MISERQFSAGFASFWRQNIPFLENIIRKQNLMAERYAGPLRAIADKHHRGFVNELGYRLFAFRSGSVGDGLGQVAGYTEADIIESVARYIGRLDRLGHAFEYDPKDLEEAEIITRRIEGFFGNVLGSPPTYTYKKIAGCGILDSMVCDAISGRVLLEFKAGQRNFRSTDVKQAITYLIANSVSHQHQIDRFCLCNPRTGLYFIMGLDEFSYEASGISWQEFVERVEYFLTSQVISDFTLEA